MFLYLVKYFLSILFWLRSGLLLIYGDDLAEPVAEREFRRSVWCIVCTPDKGNLMCIIDRHSERNRGSETQAITIFFLGYFNAWGFHE